VDNADTAFLSKRNRKPRLCDCVHRGGNKWDIERDFARESCRQIDVARQNYRVGGKQQDIVKG
jgi:hypothetical protein